MKILSIIPLHQIGFYNEQTFFIPITEFLQLLIVGRQDLNDFDLRESSLYSQKGVTFVHI